MIRSLGIGRRTAAALTGLLMIGALVTVLSGSAQASVPDHWGFALVTQPAVAGIPPVSHQAGNWPPAFQGPHHARRPRPGIRALPADRGQGRGRARDRGDRHRGLVPGPAVEPLGRRRDRRRALLQGPRHGGVRAVRGHVHAELQGPVPGRPGLRLPALPARFRRHSPLQLGLRGQHRGPARHRRVAGHPAWPRLGRPGRERAGHAGQPGRARQVRGVPVDLGQGGPGDPGPLLPPRHRADEHRLDAQLPARPGDHGQPAQAVRLHLRQQARRGRPVRARPGGAELQLRWRREHHRAVRRRAAAGHLPAGRAAAQHRAGDAVPGHAGRVLQPDQPVGHHRPARQRDRARRRLLHRRRRARRRPSLVTYSASR